MADWIDELFEPASQCDYSNPMENSRRFAASLVRSSTLAHEEKDDIIDSLLDFTLDMTTDEIQDIIVRMQLNQLDPMNFYAPSKREINAHIRKLL